MWPREAVFAETHNEQPSNGLWQTLAEEIDLSGYWETRLALRLRSDPEQKPFSLAETRLQLEGERDFDAFTIEVTADIVFDAVSDERALGLDGDGDYVDLRRASVSFSPLDFVDIKVGRQILTWGTGDLIFINDLFAKDWRSFLLGRSVEYLKAPTDAVKASFFSTAANLDIVYVPEFGADRYIDGSRVSFFDPATAGLRGRSNPLTTDEPSGWFTHDEVSARFYRTLGPFEVAAYYYDGYWKSPAGLRPDLERAFFPRLHVYGASLRGPMFGGISSAEFGFYDSQSGASRTPLIQGNEIRALVGYERDLGQELTLGLQYSFEHKQDSDFDIAEDARFEAPQKNRHLLTLRLTKQFWQQRFEASVFNFYAPKDKDGHLRLKAAYKFSDAIKLEAGLNIFYGSQATFFGQFKRASNLTTALRFNF